MSDTEHDRPEPVEEQDGMTISLKHLATIAQVLGLLGVFAAGISAWNGLGNDIARIDREIATRSQARDAWVAGHETLHKERLAEVRNREGAVDARLSAMDGQIRKLDELSFRVGATEQSAKTTAEAIKNLEATVNDQSANIRVMREILERQEERRRSEVKTR